MWWAPWLERWAPTFPAWTLHYFLQFPLLHCSPFTSQFCSQRNSQTDASKKKSYQVPLLPKLSWSATSSSEKSQSNILKAHMIWRTLDFISVPLSSSYDGLLTLPWARRHSPALVLWHWRLPCLERTCSRHPCGHSFMSFASLLKGHLLNEAHTDNDALVKQPPSLSPHTYMLGLLPQSIYQPLR